MSSNSPQPAQEARKGRIRLLLEALRTMARAHSRRLDEQHDRLDGHESRISTLEKIILELGKRDEDSLFADAICPNCQYTFHAISPGAAGYIERHGCSTCRNSETETKL